MTDSPVPESVVSFLSKSSRIIGNVYAEGSSIDLYQQCCDLQSPIEQLFLIAFRAVAEVNGFKVSSRPSLASVGDLVLIPQYQIGTYRVDFVAYMAIPEHCQPEMVVIECDGHDFHDRDKKQRSYEKRRDRDLQKKGFKVFRFTGSDITADPYECASEIIEIVARRLIGDEGRTMCDPSDYDWEASP